ncbi:MAG TPA: CARDB domain-containing protein [Mycobacteriales bacterium]|nr:CARDB domain-containing protein [Mycobacteriales bacterium]
MVRISRRAMLGGVGAGAVLAGVSAPAAAAAGRAPRQFMMGAGTHFSQGAGYVPGNLELLREMGATALRDETPWSAVETQRGVLRVPPANDAFVTAAVAAGIDPLLILDYGNPLYDKGERPTSDDAIAGFGRYAEFMARHFHGRVATFEIWNEWNIAIGGVTGPGDPGDYVRLLAATYPRIKAVDPRITVVGGAVAGLDPTYIGGLLDAGILQHCDVFSVHPYIYGDLPLERREPEVWLEHMQDLQATLRRHNGGRDFPVYVTEVGWPTQIDDRGVSQELAAAYCSRMYLLARTLPWLKGLWWYDFQDDGWQADYNEHNFGLVRPDLTPKDAFHAYRSVAGVVGSGGYRRRLAADEPVWALSFQDGQDVLALWNSALDDDYSVVLRSPDPRRAVTITEAGRPPIQRHWGRRAWYDDHDAPIVGDELELTTRRTPILLNGDLSGVVVSSVTKRPFPENDRSTGPCRPGPDMVVTAITAEPANPKVGEHVVFTATVQNQGNEATPDGVVTGVSFEVDFQQVAWSDTVTASIPAGGTATCRASAGPAGTNYWTPAAAGTVQVTAIVNDIFRYPESEGTNNATTVPLAVQ